MKIRKATLALVPFFLLACAQKPKLAAAPPSPTSAAKPADADRSAALEQSRLKIQDLIAEAFKPVYFPFDKAELSQKSRDLLAKAGDLLKEEPSVKVLIQGNTDERGTEDYNLALGQKRAYAVKAYLTGYGVDASQLNIISYGKEKPAQAGHDESAWAMNRRDDFKVTF